MKRLLLLPMLLLMATCGNSSSIRPTCDTQGVGLKHVVNGNAGTRGSEYHISISVDGTAMEAIADTGSSNLLVANNIGFSPKGNATGGDFQIQYGDPASSTVSLTPYAGSVDLNCGPGVTSYNYGYIKNYTSNNGTTEATLLGLAYRDIQQPPAADDTSTFFKQLVTNNPSISNEFSMLLCGVGNSNSKITFGGTGSTPISSFKYVPVIENSYYVINGGAVKINGTQMGKNLTNEIQTRTIVDSGTTVNLVPQDVYDAIVKKLGENNTGARPQTVISCPNTSGMPNITIELDNSVTLTLTPNTYFKQLGGGQCFFGFAPAGNLSILGQVTMENYKVHFDRKFNNNQGRIGFAPNTECGN